VGLKSVRERATPGGLALGWGACVGGVGELVEVEWASLSLDNERKGARETEIRLFAAERRMGVRAEDNMLIWMVGGRVGE
jgi:hypothetical protein